MKFTSVYIFLFYRLIRHNSTKIPPKLKYQNRFCGTMCQLQLWGKGVLWVKRYR